MTKTRKIEAAVWKILVNLAAFRTECRRHTCRRKRGQALFRNKLCHRLPRPAKFIFSALSDSRVRHAVADKYQRITLLNLEPALADLLVLDETLVFLQLHHMTTAQKNASRVIIFN